MSDMNKMMMEMLLSRILSSLGSSNEAMGNLNLTPEESGMVNNLLQQLQSGQPIDDNNKEGLLIVAAKIARQANLGPANTAQIIGLAENLLGKDKVTPEMRAKINEILNS